MGLVSVGTLTHWLVFLGIVFVLLALDLGVFHRKSHAIGLREALIWSAVWISLSLCFNGWVLSAFGRDKGLEFFTGYLLEKSLSVDNLFVFLLLFRHFAVRAEVQHRVLFWGIIGALITRGIFILGGTALVQTFHWVLYLFGAFLVIIGIKLLFETEPEVDPKKNLALRVFRRFFPATDEYDGAKFFTRKEGRLLATPLILVLITVETTDVLFAVDSVPAVFGVTTDPFIVFTSNIFAILGLRALYFVLAGVMHRFPYLHIGLGLVLAFIGVKMLVEHWVKIPIWASLLVIAGLISTSMLATLFVRPRAAAEEKPQNLPDAED